MASSEQPVNPHAKVTVVNATTGETKQITEQQWANRANDQALKDFERSDEEGGEKRPSA